ncbi:MAG: tyrosinase family protein [Solirubrobacteraceae bacterium]
MNANTPVYVRRDIWALTPGDPIVTGYAKAVKHLKERSADDPRSWSYQAAIHGTETTPNKPEWNECQHGTWFFLPWHRIFVAIFERIVRQAVIETGGPEDWALPYWNYGEGGEHARLPLAFREPTLPDGEANPLYVAARAEGMNNGNGQIPLQAGSPAKALARPHFIGRAEFGGDRTTPKQFSKSGGEVEETPHNVVHGLVGGEAGLMGNILTAAQDPIFWLHHANIDRIWADWSGAPGAAHQDPQEPSWLGQSFSFFDEQGRSTSMRCEQVLETVAIGYRYDTQPSLAPAAAAPTVAGVSPPPRELVGATEQPVTLTGEPVTVTVPIDARATEPFGAQVHVYLNVEEIQGKANPGTSYAVYAGVGPGTPAAERDARRIGNLSFFGIEGAENPAGDQPPHTLGSSYEMTGIARELEQTGDWAGHELPVTFEPFTLEPAAGAAAGDLESVAHAENPVELGRISVFYDA